MRSPQSVTATANRHGDGPRVARRGVTCDRSAPNASDERGQVHRQGHDPEQRERGDVGGDV